MRLGLGKTGHAVCGVCVLGWVSVSGRARVRVRGTRACLARVRSSVSWRRRRPEYHWLIITPFITPTAPRVLER